MFDFRHIFNCPFKYFAFSEEFIRFFAESLLKALKIPKLEMNFINDICKSIENYLNLKEGNLQY